MTHLRKMMPEDLQRRNYPQDTIRSYIHTGEDFARHFNCRPDRLGFRHIREYQAELFEKRKLSPGSVAVRLAALRFFYCKTLKKSWSIAETSYPKKDHRLPAILSQEALAPLTPKTKSLALSGQPRPLRRSPDRYENRLACEKKREVRCHLASPSRAHSRNQYS